MSELTNYIKERITNLKHDLEVGTGWQSTKARYGIWELQAVLSKIEEIEKKEFEKIVQVGRVEYPGDKDIKYQEYLAENKRENEGKSEYEQMGNPAFSYNAWKQSEELNK